MKPVFFVALTLATTLGTVAVTAETLPKGASDSCATYYKKANGTKCVGIQGAGAATGCVTAGTPTVTNNNGQSSVTISWASTGTGKYSWNNVGDCIPNPLYCEYTCSAKAQTTMSEVEIAEMFAIRAVSDAVTQLLGAEGAEEVSAALSGGGESIGSLPYAARFTPALHRAALNELEGLRGAESVSNRQLQFTLSVEPAADADYAERWGSEADFSDADGERP